MFFCSEWPLVEQILTAVAITDVPESTKAIALFKHPDYNSWEMQAAL